MATRTETTTAVEIHRAGPEDAGTVMEMVREIAAHEGQLQHLSVTIQRWTEFLTRPEVIVLLARQDATEGAHTQAVDTCQHQLGEDHHVRPTTGGGFREGDAIGNPPVRGDVLAECDEPVAVGANPHEQADEDGHGGDRQRCHAPRRTQVGGGEHVQHGRWSREGPPALVLIPLVEFRTRAGTRRVGEHILDLCTNKPPNVAPARHRTCVTRSNVS